MRRRKSLQVLDDASILYSTCTHDDVQVRLHMPRNGAYERNRETVSPRTFIAELWSPDSSRMLAQICMPSLFFTITTQAHHLCILGLQQHRAKAESGC